MPVAPIYQPEVAARAVHWAAHHRRREQYVGISTVYTVIGNKLAPGIAERYLARTAISGQQIDGGRQTEDNERPRDSRETAGDRPPLADATQHFQDEFDAPLNGHRTAFNGSRLGNLFEPPTWRQTTGRMGASTRRPTRAASRPGSAGTAG